MIEIRRLNRIIVLVRLSYSQFKVPNFARKESKSSGVKGTIVLVVLLGPISALVAQEDLSGRRQYPQFRTSSGLPGSGLGIDVDGRPSVEGARTISIPVSYSLANGVWVGGLSFTSQDLKPRFPKFESSESEFRGNGTGWLMTGFSGNWGRLTAGMMVLSSRFDTAINLLYTPPRQSNSAVFAIGVQDLLGDGGASGQAIDEVEGGNSRSLFITSTYSLGKRAFATAGIGTNRFRFGFFGANWSLDPSWGIQIEHDGYNFNGGITYSLKLSSTETRKVGTITVGTIRGKYLYLGIGFGF